MGVKLTPSPRKSYPKKTSLIRVKASDVPNFNNEF